MKSRNSYKLKWSVFFRSTSLIIYTRGTFECSLAVANIGNLLHMYVYMPVPFKCQ